MDLVYECFVKLGLRYICVLKDGKYAGMVSAVCVLGVSERCADCPIRHTKKRLRST